MRPLQQAQEQFKIALAAWSRVIRFIWKVNPRSTLLLLLIMFLSGLIPGVQIQITNLIIQTAVQVIQAKQNAQLLHLALLFGLLQGACMVVATVLSSSQEAIEAILRLRMEQAMNLQIMEQAIALDIRYFEDDEFYDLLQRASHESMFRPYQIFTQVTTLGSQLTSLLSVALVLISWNWWLGIILLLAPLPSAWVQVWYGQKSYEIERGRSPQRRLHSYFQFLMTHVSFAKELRLFRLGDYFFGQYQKLYNNFSHVDSTLAKKQAFRTLPWHVTSDVIATGAQLYAITSSIALGQIGMLAGYLQGISIVRQNMTLLLYGLGQLYQNNLFVSNVFEYLDIVPEQKQSGGRSVPQKLKKGIEFRNLSFMYPGTTELVLKNVTLFLPAGTCTMLVGENGAGKSTLVKLLTRLYEPTEGQILLDDISIQEYNLEDLRRHVSAIFQDFARYDLSLRENIGFGSIDYLHDDARIKEAAIKSDAAGIVESLPQGYETILGRMFEGGHELSIGQWQKIALARAFMHQPALIILDEPTASIDARSETTIFKQLQEGARETTLLLISHRFSSASIADKIVVLEHGQIVEEGTHESLMQADAVYASLFRLQAAAYLHDQ